MVSLVARLLVISLVCLSSHGALGAPAALVNVVFVNGIWNTLEDAQASSLDVQEALDFTRTRSEAEKRRFVVSFVYNPTGWEFAALDPERSRENDDRDLIELFMLKTAEECFREDFRLISVPHNHPQSINRDAATRVKRFLDNMIPSEVAATPICGATALSSAGTVTAQDLEPTRETVIRLVQRIRTLGSAVVVAHSQGNLLANLAYASLASEFGDEVSGRMRLVNVANTSELSANDLDLTHSRDAALGYLKFLPTKVNDGLGILGDKYQGQGARATTECNPLSICPFVLSAPTLATDESLLIVGHGFVGTYLSDSAVSVIRPQEVPITSGAVGFVDRFVDFVYAAAASLEVGAKVGPTIPDSGQPQAVSVVSGQSATFTVQANGSGPLTYQWRRNGLPIACSTGTDCPHYATPPTSLSDSGAIYDVVVSNSVGSVTSAGATLTVTTTTNGTPDLSLVAVTFSPNTAAAGATIQVALTVTNQGSAAASPSTAALRINQSTTSATGSTVATVSVPAIPTGGSVSLSTVVPAVPTVPGTYRLWVVLDNDRTSGQSAAQEGNDINLAPGTLSVTGVSTTGPDLVAVNVAVDPAPVSVGGMVLASFTVTNLGDSASNSSRATVRINQSASTASGAPDLAAVLVPSLAPGESRTFIAAVNAPSILETYRLWVVADSTQSAGQTPAAVGNDEALAANSLTVRARFNSPNGSAEGAYEGALSGSSFPGFRALVLESGEFWSIYGRQSGGTFMSFGFVQGTATSVGGQVTASSVKDFGYYPALSGSLSSTYNLSDGTISGTFNWPAGPVSFSGGPIALVPYEYDRFASMDEVSGDWGLTSSTADTVALRISTNLTVSAVTRSGCTFTGTMLPRASGKNVFTVSVRFGPAPCALPGQAVQGIGWTHKLPDGRSQLTLAGVNETRDAGFVATGAR